MKRSFYSLFYGTRRRITGKHLRASSGDFSHRQAIVLLHIQPSETTYTYNSCRHRKGRSAAIDRPELLMIGGFMMGMAIILDYQYLGTLSQRMYSLLPLWLPLKIDCCSSQRLLLEGGFVLEVFNLKCVLFYWVCPWGFSPTTDEEGDFDLKGFLCVCLLYAYKRSFLSASWMQI